MFVRAPVRQLISIIAPLVLVVILMLALSVGSMSLLSAARAFVTGEGIRVRAERDAVALLRTYVRTGSEPTYVMFRQDLGTALASRTARLALQQNPPDLPRAAAALRAAGNHPGEVAGMIRLFRLFEDLPQVTAGVALAAQRDSLILQLEGLATRARAQWANGGADAGAMTAEIAALQRELQPLQTRSAADLDAVARAAQVSLLLMLAIGSTLLVAMGTLACRGLLRRSDAIAAALRATEALAYNEQERADVTLRSIADAVISADRAGHIDYMNAAAERLTGWKFAEARGQRIQDVCLLDSIDVDTSASGVVAKLSDTSGNFEGSKSGILRRRDGSSVTIHEHAAPIKDRNGRMIGMVLVLRDITQERAFTEQLEHQASHDALTGLVNRAEFERRLRMAVDAPRGDREHAVLYFDLDQFKVVNDTCGHSAGDELIRRVATVVHEQLRGSDTLARLGGDEFGALLLNCGRDAAMRVAEGIRHAISEARFPWQGKTFAVTASIGVLVIDRHLRNVSDIMTAADHACFAAKDGGRNRVQMYRADDRELNARHNEMEWVNRVNWAMENGRMLLHAQEIRPLGTPLAAGAGDGGGGPMVEILLRMLDEQGRLIAPMAFIPAAERYSLITRVDRWVIRQALHEIALLDAAGARPPVCLINLSAASMQDNGIAAYIGEELAMHGVPASRIGFEFTETAVITHLSKATHLMRKLKELGCHVALDDFGSGMSAFAYLRSLPVDYLKIDGNFIGDMAKDPVVYAMVEAIQRVGSVIGIRTIAEWVEDESTLAALTVTGMDYVQGYAIGRPEPLSQLVRTLAGFRRIEPRVSQHAATSEAQAEPRRARGLRLIS